MRKRYEIESVKKAILIICIMPIFRPRDFSPGEFPFPDCALMIVNRLVIFFALNLPSLCDGAMRPANAKSLFWKGRLRISSTVEREIRVDKWKFYRSYNFCLFGIFPRHKFRFYFFRFCSHNCTPRHIFLFFFFEKHRQLNLLNLFFFLS